VPAALPRAPAHASACHPAPRDRSDRRDGRACDPRPRARYPGPRDPRDGRPHGPAPGDGRPAPGATTSATSHGFGNRKKDILV